MGSVSTFITNRLQEWGVHRIFGYSGDGINGLLGALHEAEDAIEFIQVRHEESAAFMSCAHAKFTSETGVCLATGGPGAIPYAIAAKMAYPERVPVALIGDGVMQMLGITNLITIAWYWRRWADPRLVVLVLNNHDLAQVTWEMRAMEGDPKFEALDLFARQSRMSYNLINLQNPPI